MTAAKTSELTRQTNAYNIGDVVFVIGGPKSPFYFRNPSEVAMYVNDNGLGHYFIQMIQVSIDNYQIVLRLPGFIRNDLIKQGLA